MSSGVTTAKQINCLQTSTEADRFISGKEAKLNYLEAVIYPEYNPMLDDPHPTDDISQRIDILAACDESVFIVDSNGKVVRYTPQTNTEVTVLELGPVEFGWPEDLRLRG
jgi:hypothetical protein